MDSKMYYPHQHSWWLPAIVGVALFVLLVGTRRPGSAFTQNATDLAQYSPEPTQIQSPAELAALSNQVLAAPFGLPTYSYSNPPVNNGLPAVLWQTRGYPYTRSNAMGRVT